MTTGKDDVVVVDDFINAADMKEQQKNLDIEKAKIRRSIEDFKEQKRLKELLGDDFED